MREDSLSFHSKDSLLNSANMAEMNEYSQKLSDYLTNAHSKKKKLSESSRSSASSKALITDTFVQKTINQNTQNNSATGAAQLLSAKIAMNRKRNDSNQKNRDSLMIFAQTGQIEANQKILRTISEFHKAMKELSRHYWNCFPLSLSQAQ